MNRVTRERVEALRDQYQLGAGYAADCEPDDKVGITTAAEAQSMFTDVAAALTRLLALEDALKEVGPALEEGAHHLTVSARNFENRRDPYMTYAEQAKLAVACVEHAAQLRALAALGGDT